MILSHFTNELFVFDPSMKYGEARYYKPRGLWLSDEVAYASGTGDKVAYGWKKWCEESGFCSTEYETKFKVDTKNVLLLNTDSMIEDFSIKYIKKCEYTGFRDRIDWEKVSKEYDGIIISPYSWKLRTKYVWYNTWDCASGCIWNLSCLSIVNHCAKLNT